MPELLLDYLFFKIHHTFILSSHSRDRIVVSTLRCGRSNPGSNPGHGKTQLFFQFFYFFRDQTWLDTHEPCSMSSKNDLTFPRIKEQILIDKHPLRAKNCVIKGMFALSPLHDGCDIEKTVLHIRYCEICFRIALYYCTSVQKCRHEF